MSKESFQILDGILKLIDRDVRLIKKSLSKGEALDPDTALTITRYASALRGIVDDEDEAKRKASLKFKRLPTEELLKLFNEKHGKPKEEKT
jgi:hypothetical protein